MDMRRSFTLDYWADAGGFVGRLREVPGVFSQGESLADLEANIRDAYALVLADRGARRTAAETQSARRSRSRCEATGSPA
jgi:predicted RNase H-like HicB family nuclease